MKNKKIINLGLLTLAFAFLGASHALASSVSLSPTENTFAPGQSFSMTISVDPATSKIYTSKVALSFPADILEVESFTLSSGWQALTQSGYDLVDNNGGNLIKTAGYTGGISNKTTFGVVKFRVKKVGVAKVSVSSSSSALYDENSKNVLSGKTISTFTVLSPVVEPEIQRLPVETKPSVVQKTVTTEVKTEVKTVVPEKKEEKPKVVVPERASNLASVNETSIYRETFLLILAIVGSFILGLLVGRKTKNI